jgi:hypothetical protein
MLAVQYLIPEKSAQRSVAVGYLFCVLIGAASVLACRQLAPGLEMSPARILLVAAVGPFPVAAFVLATHLWTERAHSKFPPRPSRVVQVTELLRVGPAVCFYALIFCGGLTTAWVDAQLLFKHFQPVAGPHFLWDIGVRGVLLAKFFVGPGLLVWPWLARRGYSFRTIYAYALAANMMSAGIEGLFAVPFVIALQLR